MSEGRLVGILTRAKVLSRRLQNNFQLLRLGAVLLLTSETAAAHPATLFTDANVYNKFKAHNRQRAGAQMGFLRK